MTTLNSFRLLAMDMDSTLITIECIDEIADYAGKKVEVAGITAAAMRGEIDWPTSLRQRVSALAGLREDVLRAVFDERLRLSPGVERLIGAAQEVGLKTMVVSGGFTYFTERLRAQLGLDYAFSNTLEIIDGALTGRVIGVLCDAEAKAAHVVRVAQRVGASRAQIMVIGDGANDLKMMAEAGVSIAYKAKPVVQTAATHAINEGGLDQILALYPKAP